jgi:hypothetical protein
MTKRRSFVIRHSDLIRVSGFVIRILAQFRGFLLALAIPTPAYYPARP